MVRNLHFPLMLLVLLASQIAVSEDRHLSDVGMFYVGGSLEDGATQYTGQALVHYFKSDGDQGVPVVFYPGLGLSSYIYVSTPDGRQGWAQQFALSGHPSYVYDPVNTGPSGMPVAAFRGDAPAFVSTWNINQIWRRWGFGDSRDTPYEDVRFPVEHIDQFYASWPPRLAAAGMGTAAAGGMGAPQAASGMGDVMGAGQAMAAMGRRGGMGGQEAPLGAQGDTPAGMGGGQGQGSRGGGGPDTAAVIELLSRTGSAVLVPHSMGGATMFQVAARRPELVQGIVVIEPVGCPRNGEQVEPWAKSVPFLAVYGDYLESRGQTGRLEACRETARLVNEAGGTGSMLELTSEGIHGNTHLLMQDDNSADIAGRIIAWIKEQVQD